MKKIIFITAVIVLTVILVSGCKKSTPSSPAATATPAAPVLTATITPTSSITPSFTVTASITPTVTPTATNTYAIITGNLILPDDQSGKTYQVIVDLNTDFADGFYMKSGVCSAGTSVPYSLTGPAGTYYVYAVIKLQSTVAETPKAGDYVGSYDGVGTAVWPNQTPATVTVANGETKSGINIKVELAQVNVNGTITLSTPDTDLKGGIVILDADQDPSNGFYSYEGFITGSTQTTVAYNLLALFPDTYYIYGFVDVDGSGVLNGPNSGDYIGDANSGSAISITDVNVGATGSPYNFSLTLKP